MSITTTTKPAAAVIQNGVNVTALFDTIEAVKREPAIAGFQFRAANSWLGGGRNRSTIKGFRGAGREDDARLQPFTLDADEPAVLLGEDRAATPVEFVLHALASCLTTTMVYHAAARGIAIESVDSTLEGDLDLRGFLGLSAEVRKGYQQIRVRMRVKTTASSEQLTVLSKFSPVYDIVSNSVPVDVVIETSAP